MMIRLRSVAKGVLLVAMLMASNAFAAPYSQVLTQHIMQAHTYPQEAKTHGIEGDVLVRVRLNQAGNIVLYQFEPKPGHPLLLEAVHKMMRASNPAPQPPAELFQGKDHVDFMFPIVFRLGDDLSGLGAVEKSFVDAVKKAYEEQ